MTKSKISLLQNLFFFLFGRRKKKTLLKFSLNHYNKKIKQLSCDPQIISRNILTRMLENVTCCEFYISVTFEPSLVL